VPSSMNQIVEGPLPHGLLCRRKVCMIHPLILLHRRQLSFGRSELERTGRRVLHGNRKNHDRGVRRDGVECGEISASSERRRLTSIPFQERAKQAGGKQYRGRRGGWRGRNGNLAQVHKVRESRTRAPLPSTFAAGGIADHFIIFRELGR
jgi:hypothetical protein